MNVAATLALTVKPAKVKVQVISDPKVKRNTHEIQVKWRFGEMALHFANEPHPDNPHTSALAAWSAIKLLQRLLKSLDLFASFSIFFNLKLQPKQTLKQKSNPKHVAFALPIDPTLNHYNKKPPKTIPQPHPIPLLLVNRKQQQKALKN